MSLEMRVVVVTPDLVGRQMDATAIVDYFAPLKTWLDTQNQSKTCGW